MAKAKKGGATGAAAKGKKKSVKLGSGVELKLRVSRGKKGGAKKDGAGKASTSKSHSAADALAKLVESPLVADLIAVGATAAVAAIAAGMTDKNGVKSRSSVKNAGKAAASAIGARLMSEFSALKEAGKGAKAKTK